MDKNILKDKSLNFAVRMMNLCSHLCETKHEFDVSKQILRSGTSIGAMQREAFYAESDLDFIHKQAVAQKECNETIDWLEVLYKSNYLTETEYNLLLADATELLKMITASIMTIKCRLKVDKSNKIQN